MSIHPSLSSSSIGQKQRSVLKRIERIKTLMEKGLWKEPNPIFGLPKIKTIRIKIKKEKAAKTAEAVTAEGGATASTSAAPTQEAKSSKEQAQAKTTSAKPSSKDKA